MEALRLPEKAMHGLASLHSPGTLEIPVRLFSIVTSETASLGWSPFMHGHQYQDRLDHLKGNKMGKFMWLPGKKV